MDNNIKFDSKNNELPKHLTNKDYSETKRKLFHLLTILYPIFYNIWPKNLTIIVAGSLILLDIIVESLRIAFPTVNKIILKPLKGIYRDSETYNISTLIWTFTGAFLTIFIFFDDRTIVTPALLYMVFGDWAAGLVGAHRGRIKIGYKSLEGSITCFIVCFICGIFFLPLPVAILCALVATIVELLPLPLNDNFWMPLISAFAIRFFKKIL
ncbi:MAG: hypothetical protein QME68_01815 [Elusimicrobiota bacterium]|nr:hypothetical protein [Elusimicrobiota bacterium]